METKYTIDFFKAIFYFIDEVRKLVIGTKVTMLLASYSIFIFIFKKMFFL